MKGDLLSVGRPSRFTIRAGPACISVLRIAGELRQAARRDIEGVVSGQGRSATEKPLRSFLNATPVMTIGLVASGQAGAASSGAVFGGRLLVTSKRD